MVLHCFHTLTSLREVFTCIPHLVSPHGLFTFAVADIRACRDEMPSKVYSGPTYS